MTFEKNVISYLKGRTPDSRYASFDYCFYYFQSFRESRSIEALADPSQIQLSCLHLGFYLASWGMLRGSAELLRRSVRCLIPVIEAIARVKTVIWELDAHCYTDESMQQLLDTSHILKRSYPGMSDILVTKIMLGVFGNVPAFDTNFKKGFRVSTFGLKALRKIRDFYRENSAIVDRLRVPTLDFLTGEPTGRMYTRAKVVDMAFFIEGMP